MIKTERKLPISDAEVAARLRNRTQRALADELGVSKTSVAKALGRHERAGERRSEAIRRTSAVRERPVECQPEVVASGPVDILARLEHEAIHSKDGRSRIAALKELAAIQERREKEDGPRFVPATLLLGRQPTSYSLTLRARGKPDELIADELSDYQVLAILAQAFLTVPDAPEPAPDAPENK